MSCEADLPCERRRLLVNLLRRWEELYPLMIMADRRSLTQLNRLYVATGNALKDEEDDEVW